MILAKTFEADIRHVSISQNISDADMRHIVDEMRPEDRIEAQAMGAMTPASAVNRSLDMSHEFWVGRVDEVAVCIYGLCIGSLASGLARPWLLGTTRLDQHKYAFLRRNLRVVRRWSSEWRMLENYVDGRNEKSIAWLKWLGFTIDEPAPYGPFGVMFSRFWMKGHA